MDLRCYGLATPRHDGKVSVHLQDLDNFYQEWDIDSLPWDSVAPIPPGQEHPEELDQRLTGALNEVVIRGIDEQKKSVRGAVLAFLYLYMILCRHDDRSVDFAIFIVSPRARFLAHTLLVRTLTHSPFQTFIQFRSAINTSGWGWTGLFSVVLCLRCNCQLACQQAHKSPQVANIS